MPEREQHRRERLRKAVADRGLDGVLVTRLVNVRYLTGFTGSNGALLVTPDAAVLATDGRYTTQSAAQAPDVERVIDRAVATALAGQAQGRGLRRLGFESHDVSVDLHGALAAAAPDAELTSAGPMVEQLRATKDADEVALLREACAIADAAFAGLLPTLRAGRTEREIADDLEARMRALGADGPSFETIVAGGPNSAVPHHRPTGRPVEAGELLKLDFGALRGGYHSDMTRTVVLGPPADWQRELYDLVAAAQTAGREALVPGVATAAVDRAARRVVEAAGRGEEFVHGLGHGVGLEIHEAPAIGSTSSDTLDVGMVVTVEPGVYLPGRGGVRIEDTLVVAPGGAANELLTMTTKELLVV